MTSLPLWKARHGQNYVTLLNDNSQSSGEHANPPHNSSPRKPTSSVSWSVFIWFGISFWHFSAVELQLHSFFFFLHSALICLLSVNKFCVIRSEVKGLRCRRSVMLNPKATSLAAGCGCCCTSVKHLDRICQAVCFTAWRYKYEKNNHFLLYLHWCPWGKRQSSQWLHITF